jgi:HAMP domain-containing protein
MAANPYAEFQKPAAAAASADPYAEFQKPATQDTPPDAGGQMRTAALGKVEATMPAPTSERLGNVAKGAGTQMLSNLSPSNIASSMGQLISHPIDSLTAGMSGFRDKASKDLSAGNYSDAIQHGIEGSVPVLGPMLGRGLDAVGSNNDEEAGKSLGNFASLEAAPALMKGAGKMLSRSAEGPTAAALSFTKNERGLGRTPERAALDETSGVTLPTIRAQAQGKLGIYNPQLETMVDASRQPVSLSPARKILDDATDKAVEHNSESTANQINPMRAQLARRFSTGESIPETVTPRDALNLKRGFGDEFTNWKRTQESTKGANDTAKSVYHSLDSELDMAVPGSQELNQKISSLIPVSQKAASGDLNAGILQQIANKMRAPTGAMATSIAGALAGSHLHGPEGGIVGGLTGLIAPQLMGSPTAQMLAARGLDYSGKAISNPAVAQTARAGSLFKRKDQTQK